MEFFKFRGTKTRNQNIEIRDVLKASAANNDQIHQIQMTEIYYCVSYGKHLCFEHLNIRVLNLFRISDFVFWICNLLCSVKLTAKIRIAEEGVR